MNENKWTKILLLISITTVFAGCTGVKNVVRSVNDVARQLCELTASEAGQSPKDWCNVRENLDPFIREVTAAQSAASAQSGLSQQADDGGS